MPLSAFVQSLRLTDDTFFFNFKVLIQQDEAAVRSAKADRSSWQRKREEMKNDDETTDDFFYFFDTVFAYFY